MTASSFEAWAKSRPVKMGTPVFAMRKPKNCTRILVRNGPGGGGEIQRIMTLGLRDVSYYSFFRIIR